MVVPFISDGKDADVRCAAETNGGVEVPPKTKAFAGCVGEALAGRESLAPAPNRNLKNLELSMGIGEGIVDGACVTVGLTAALVDVPPLLALLPLRRRCEVDVSIIEGVVVALDVLGRSD